MLKLFVLTLLRMPFFLIYCLTVLSTLALLMLIKGVPFGLINLGLLLVSEVFGRSIVLSGYSLLEELSCNDKKSIYLI